MLKLGENVMRLILNLTAEQIQTMKDVLSTSNTTLLEVFKQAEFETQVREYTKKKNEERKKVA